MPITSSYRLTDQATEAVLVEWTRELQQPDFYSMKKCHYPTKYIQMRLLLRIISSPYLFHKLTSLLFKKEEQSNNHSGSQLGVWTLIKHPLRWYYSGDWVNLNVSSTIGRNGVQRNEFKIKKLITSGISLGQPNLWQPSTYPAKRLVSFVS